MTYSALEWQTSTAEHVTISNGTITGTDTSSNYTSNARSTSVITTTDSIKFTLENTTDNFVAGLGKDPYSSTPHTFTAIEYGMHFSTNWYIYENGSLADSFTGSSTDTAKITRSGSQIFYYVNDVLKYTSTNQTTDDLYAQFSAQGGASITMETNADQAAGGGGDPEPGTPLQGEGTIIEHILYLNTRVPK